MNKRLVERIICCACSHFICKTNSEEWNVTLTEKWQRNGYTLTKIDWKAFSHSCLNSFLCISKCCSHSDEKKQNLSHFFINQGKYLGSNMLACQSVVWLIMTLRKVVLHTFPKRAFDNLCASPSILRSLLVVFWAFLVFFAGATLGEQLILLSTVLCSPTTFSKSSMIVPSDC